MMGSTPPPAEETDEDEAAEEKFGWEGEEENVGSERTSFLYDSRRETCQDAVPKEFEGSVFTNAASVIGLDPPEPLDDGGGERVEAGERGRWNPAFVAALMMRSFRQVRCGSSCCGRLFDGAVAGGAIELMMVELEEVVEREFWEYPLRVLEPEDHCWAWWPRRDDPGRG